MDKKLVVLTAMFAISAGLVCAQEMNAAAPAADTMANAMMNEEVMNEDKADMMNDENSEMMANEEMTGDDMNKEEAPAAEPAAPAAPADNKY